MVPNDIQEINAERIAALPSADDLRERYPREAEHRIAEHVGDIRAILSGTDPRLLMIIGPCSIHTKQEFEEYVGLVAELQHEAPDAKLIIRAHSQKPRTTIGWKGVMYEPSPGKPADISAGITQTREMLWDIGRRYGTGFSDEALYPSNGKYVQDLLSYIAIGARSTTNQSHREYASRINRPVGVKNPSSGSITETVQGVLAAQSANDCAIDDYHERSRGNPYAHAILRGGSEGPNYSPKHVAEMSHLLERATVWLDDDDGNKYPATLRNPAIVVDASHGNSQKVARGQITVVRELIANMRAAPEVHRIVRGVMLESNIYGGHQGISDSMKYGVSLTDDCLGWEATRNLVLEAAEARYVTS